MEKHCVTLTDKERRKLVAIVTKGRNKASYIQRAHILLKSADGKTDAEISQWLYISESTVRRTRLRFCQAGVDAALTDEAPPEREPLLSEQQEGHLVALACSAPPEGRERWTLELLTRQLIAEGVIDSISVESVGLVLQKTSQTLASTSVVHSQTDGSLHRADGSDFALVCSSLRPAASAGLF